MTKSNTCVKNLTSEWNQKYQHFFPNAYRPLLYIQFVAVAFQTTLKEKAPSFTNYGPALDPPLSGFGQKSIQMCGGSLKVLYPYQVW